MFAAELNALRVKMEAALEVIQASSGSRVPGQGAYMNRRQAEGIMIQGLNQVHDLLYHVGSVPDVLAPAPKPTPAPKVTKVAEPKPKVEAPKVAEPKPKVEAPKVEAKK